jgi:hypothetical protein
MPKTGSACSQARQAGLAGLPCPGRYSTKTSAANNAWKRGHEEFLRTKKKSQKTTERYTLSVVCCGVDDPNEPPMSVEY